MPQYDNLLSLVEDAANALRENFSEDPMFRIIGHHDADGISAAAIMARALYREGCRFHIRILRQLETSFIRELSEEPHTHYIFVDLGSGQLNYLEEYFSNQRYRLFIFDHHPPAKDAVPNMVHVNPHLFGIDGGTEISGAGVAYLIARALNKKNVELAPLAVVGAVGDRQDKGDDFKLIGFNSKIIEDGEKNKTILVTKDLRFFGRETRPISFSLQYSTDPYLPGLSGNHDNCIQLLASLKIPLKTPEGEWRSISSLTKEEKTKLLGGIIKFSSSRKVNPKIFRKIIGYIYSFPKEEEGTEMRDAHEYASLLNACGRTKHPGLGVAIAFGDRGRAYQEAQRFVADYRSQIAQALNWLETNRNRVKQKSHLISFNAGATINDSLISTVTSIASSSKMFDPRHVLVGLASSNDNLLKISARTTAELVEQGVDLGAAIRVAVKAIAPELEAGGHKIAAGGKIPNTAENKFLTILNREITQQIKKYALRPKDE
ncbi:MAG: DHH family phosphoesterase [Candidatus Ranarchaeia archaeon]